MNIPTIDQNTIKLAKIAMGICSRDAINSWKEVTNLSHREQLDLYIGLTHMSNILDEKLKEKAPRTVLQVIAHSELAREEFIALLDSGDLQGVSASWEAHTFPIQDEADYQEVVGDLIGRINRKAAAKTLTSWPYYKQILALDTVAMYLGVQKSLALATIIQQVSVEGYDFDELVKVTNSIITQVKS